MSELKLDEETKKSLIGLMPFSQEATTEFTPEIFKKLDIGEEFKPVFTQRSFTRKERNEMRAGAMTFRGSDVFKYARISVVGWRNLYDLATGNEIEFSADKDKGASKELFGLISDEIAAELFNNASKISGLLSAEKMGLRSSPQSTPE